MQEKLSNVESDIHPFATIYLKAIKNEKGELLDMIILNSNHNFEKLMDLRLDDICGRKITELLHDKKNSGLELIIFYANAILLKNIKENTHWISVNDEDCLLTLIPSGTDYLAAIFHEVPYHYLNHMDMKKSENLLEELRPVLNSTHDAISIVEYSNNGFYYIGNNIIHQEITGIKNIRGMSPTALLGEEVGQKLIGYYEQCMTTGQPVSYEQKFNFMPGNHIWQTEVTPVFGCEGIRYLLCSSKDITELKQIQGEKEMLTQRLQSMFEKHIAVMLLLDPKSGKIVDANPSACHFYGYSKEELLSMAISDINMLPKEEIEKKRRMAFEKKQHFYIFPHRLKNGEIRLVDVYSSPISDGENTLLYSIIFDVTDRENYKNTIFQEKEKLLTTLRSIGDGVVTTDACGCITSLNPVAQEITGWEENEAKGKNYLEVFKLCKEDSVFPVENLVQKVLETGRILGVTNHTVLINRKQKKIPIEDSAAPIMAEDGSILGVVMVLRDVSDEREHSKQIQYLSYHDSLTSLYNRRYVDEFMKHIDIEENLPITIVMGDVNGLKITNDIFGHEKGDMLLKEMARSLQLHFRKEDIIARWGGDEVIIIMLNTKQEIAEKIVRKINTSNIIVEQSGLQMSISFGCATKQKIDEHIQFVMKTAEENMYHQKLLEGKSYRSSVINSLLATLYEKSNETEEHSKRVEHYCHKVGKTLQLSLKEMNEISLLSRLHDIGKVSINANILRKSGTLTDKEWEEVKRHSEIGYRIAKATPELAMIADYILCHHERWDGKGYPRELKADEIPLPCRIFAIADAYDAMTNNRSYRTSLSKEKAIHEIERNAGSQFDPEIAKVFVEVLVNEVRTNINE